MNSYEVHTFGCKVNTYDSGLINKNMTAHEGESVSEKKIHILNTCAVTHEATSEALKLIRKLKKKDPECTIVVTGCGAQVDTHFFEKMPEADLVIANSHKSQLPNILEKHFKGESDTRIFKSNIFKKEDLEMGGGLESSHTRSFLKIQDGCNSFCTYCIIPYARGKSRSIPIGELITRVNDLHNRGVKEVVLTGVHVGDYEDGTLVLEDLLTELLVKTKMPRFRLTSFEPVEISERLLTLYSNPRVCAHFHMSIQSANTEVLTAMKRKYTDQDVEKALLRINEVLPQAFVGMDVIVGFPNETEARFEDTYQRLKKLPWNRIHVFPYSEREGTRAQGMSYEYDQRTKALRAERLRNLSSMRFNQTAREQVGDTVATLILKKPARGSDGLSRNYWPVKIQGDFPNSLRGQEVFTKLLKWTPGDHLSRDGWFEAEIVGVDL